MTAMVQDRAELEKWYSQDDPWGYEKSADDERRKAFLLSEIPARSYRRVLDIGCGQGFLTRDLPGDLVIGVDLSTQAIERARRLESARMKFEQGSLFDLPKRHHQPFDLVIITGVLYPQYIGNSNTLVYVIVDQLLAKEGILVSVHISDWYRARFPYLQLKDIYYDYREYRHKLEVYVK